MALLKFMAESWQNYVAVMGLCIFLFMLLTAGIGFIFGQVTQSICILISLWFKSKNENKKLTS